MPNNANPIPNPMKATLFLKFKFLPTKAIKKLGITIPFIYGTVCQNKLLVLGSSYIKIFLKLKSLAVDRKKSNITARQGKKQISENFKMILKGFGAINMSSKMNGSTIKKGLVWGKRSVCMNLTNVTPASAMQKNANATVMMAVVLLYGSKYPIKIIPIDINPDIRNPKKLNSSALF